MTLAALLLSGLTLDAGIVAGGQGADMLATVRALRDCPACQEANPWLRSNGQLAVGKLAVSGMTVLACRELRRQKHPKLARLLAVTVGSIGLAMAVHNMRRKP